MPSEVLEIKLRFRTFVHARSRICNEVLEIISELNNSFSLVGAMRPIFLYFCSLYELH